MLKTYEVSYRKRGLPESELKTIDVEAESFAGAKYKAEQYIGKECVVVSTNLKKEESKDANQRISETD